jgi:tRNA A37 N6-isopentenylltransferase MiaA
MITGFEQKDLPVLNGDIDSIKRRLDKVEKTTLVTPTAHVSADSTHSVPIVIGGTTYYVMLTTVAP